MRSATCTGASQPSRAAEFGVALSHLPSWEGRPAAPFHRQRRRRAGQVMIAHAGGGAGSLSRRREGLAGDRDSLPARGRRPRFEPASRSESRGMTTEPRAARLAGRCPLSCRLSLYPQQQTFSVRSWKDRL